MLDYLHCVELNFLRFEKLPRYEVLGDVLLLEWHITLSLFYLEMEDPG